MNSEKVTKQPSDQEIAQAAEVLSRLTKGFLPLPLFIQVTRLMTTPTMEVAPIRMRGDEPEVFLTQRPVDDPYWPNGWHIPGTVIRSTDEPESFRSGFDRVLRDELGPAFSYASEPVFVSMKFWDVLRGRELDMVHFVEVNVEQGSELPGKFFTLDELPETTLDNHKIMIPEIFESFRER